MSDERDQVERELRAKAETAIQKMLDALPDKSQITLGDMEALTGEMGRELMQAAMQTLSETQQRPLAQVICERCACTMQKRGKRKKRVVSVRGEIEVERQYYVCPKCGTGTFPPG